MPLGAGESLLRFLIRLLFAQYRIEEFRVTTSVKWARRKGNR